MKEYLTSKEKFFQQTLLDYWKTSGRKSLPWRQTKDPWKILLAEILLRKTTSRQAVELYEQISYLTPKQIKDLPESELVRMLQPLGLQNVRAAQLKKTAAAVDGRGPGELANPSFLDSLPGVGKYISSTVMCFSTESNSPALDTNMIRVLKRVFSVQIIRSRAREDKGLWIYAKRLVPEGSSREYNWAVLDFASAVCTARNPKCSVCPLAKICDYAENLY